MKSDVLIESGSLHDASPHSKNPCFLFITTQSHSIILSSQKVPSYPKESSLLSNDIKLHDGGWATTVDGNRHFVLSSVLFHAKDDPRKALRSTDLDHPDYIICRYCNEANPNLPEYKKVAYPGYTELGDEHLIYCDLAPQWF
jgi:hypothetical protein